MDEKAQRLLEPDSSEHVECLEPRPRPIYNSWLRWWLPEMLASALSIVAFILLIVLLHSYNGRMVLTPQFPLPFGAFVSLNGLAALLASITKSALMVPIGSCVSQEAWLWFSESKQNRSHRGRLQDLELSDTASRGAQGSLMFLLKTRGRHCLSLNVESDRR